MPIQDSHINAMQSRLLQLTALFLLPTPALAQTTWSVDPSGAGDFTDLQLAVDTVDEGDILLVEPGSYGDLELSKSLTLIGDAEQARPVIQHLVASDIDFFNLVHFRVTTAALADIERRSTIDDCVIDADLALIVSSVFAIHTTQVKGLEIQRSEVLGREFFADGYAALIVGQSSRVSIVDSLVRSRDVPADQDNCLAGLAAPAIQIAGCGTELRIAGSSVIAGDGQSLPLPFLCSEDGEADAAILILASQCVGDPPVVDVRGSSSDVFAGGWTDTAPQQPAVRIVTPVNSIVTVSGVTVEGPALAGVVQPLVPYPYLEVGGVALPGMVRRANVFGLAGDMFVLLGGTAPAFTELVELQTVPVLVDLTSLFLSHTGSLMGQDVPASLLIEQPLNPALAGLRVHFQAAQVAGSGLVGSNSVPVILGY